MSRRPDQIPSIAVVTRVSRPAKYLERVLKGLLKQTGAKLLWSIVTQNELSTAHKDCVTRATANGIIVTISKAKTDIPLGELANIGAGAVDSDFVILHDDDDDLRGDFFRAAMKAFEDETIVATTCHAAYIHEDNSRNKLDFVLSPGTAHVDKQALERDNLMATNALIYHRSANLTYPEDVEVAEDWLFNLSLIAQGKIAVLPKVYAQVFVRNGAHTNTDKSKHIDMQGEIRGDITSNRQAHNQKLTQRLRRLTDRITYKLGFFLPR